MLAWALRSTGPVGGLTSRARGRMCCALGDPRSAEGGRRSLRVDEVEGGRMSEEEEEDRKSRLTENKITSELKFK